MKKIINKIIDFIKDEYKFIILCVVIAFVMLFKLPYNLYTGGGILDINDKVEVENANKSVGTLNMAYIKQVRATIPTYLLSYIFNWDREKIEDTLKNYSSGKKDCTDT